MPVARRREILVLVVLKALSTDVATHPIKTGGPCCFASGAHRPALLRLKVDAALSLLILVLTVLLRGEVTRPMTISAPGFSAFCVPRPESQQLMADGCLHLHQGASAHLHHLDLELAKQLLPRVPIPVLDLTDLGLLLLSTLLLFAVHEI